MDYYESYENLEVHKCMLEDTPRNTAYRQAIFDNKDAFQGKTVLDVGAGTGILSIFCAQAGAARVYAVEASEVYKIAEEIVQENQVQNIVQVIHSTIETLTLPGDEKVDIIVSEWMGHFLLHEGMLDSVIFARDKFLKPEGLLFPENATLYSTPCSLPSLNEYWKDVSGVSMTTFGKKLKTQSAESPRVAVIKPEMVLADPEVIAFFDLREITLEDIDKIEYRHLTVIDKPGSYEGICLWFNCSFPASLTEPVVLTTAPDELETHWKQTMITLPTSLEVSEGMPVAYCISMQRSPESRRRYTIEVEMLDPDDVEHPVNCSCYKTKCILMKAVLEKYELQAFAAEGMDIENHAQI